MDPYDTFSRGGRTPPEHAQIVNKWARNQTYGTCGGKKKRRFLGVDFDGEIRIALAVCPLTTVAQKLLLISLHIVR